MYRFTKGCYVSHIKRRYEAGETTSGAELPPKVREKLIEQKTLVEASPVQPDVDDEE